MRLSPRPPLALCLAAALGALAALAPPAGAQVLRGGTRADTPLRPVTRATAIVGARVVQAPGRVLERATVVLRDGRIEAVGRDVRVPADADTLRGEGLTVYAGFVDALGFYGAAPDSAYRAGPRPDDPGAPPRERAGLTPERDVRTLFDPAAEDVAAWRALGFTAAHLAPRGGMLPGQGAVALLRTLQRGEPREAVFLTEPASLLAALRPARGAYPSTVMGVMAVLRDRFAEVRRRQEVARRFARTPDGERPAYDPVLDALAPALESRPVFFQVESALGGFRALRLGEELGLRRLVLAGVPDAAPLVPRLRARETFVLAPLALPDSVSVDTSLTLPPIEARPGGTTFVEARRIVSFEDVDDERAALLTQRRAAVQAYERNAAVLAEGEVPFAFATLDAEPERVRADLRRMRAAGLAEADALAALTTAPAALLGLERLLGTVEPGRLANLVVTDGDYFGDSTRVRFVFVEGVRFDGEDAAAPDSAAVADSVVAAADAAADSAAAAGAQPAEPPTPPGLRRAAGLRTAADLPPADARGDLLIRDATVLTVTGGTREHTDVLVRNGVIREIGPGLAAPPGVRVVEAAGLFLMPGIIDAHSHAGLSDVNEATNPVVAELRMQDALDPADIDLYHALAGGVTTIHTLHGSANPIGAESETIKLRWGTPDPEGLVMEGAPRTIKFALGENPTRVHGRGRGIQPATRMGVEWTLREAFEEARRYRAAQAEATAARRPPPPADRRLETLAGVLEGDVLVHAHAYRADEILMLLDVLRDYGVERVTMQHANEAFKVAPELAAWGAAASVFSDWWSYKLEVYYSTAYNAAILTRNGVRTSINSDDGEMMRHLYLEAAKAQRYGGLTDEEALALITINPAWQLGIDDRVGSIEVGKEADLALFRNHPLSVYAVPLMTVVDGVVRFDRERDGDDMRLLVDPGADVEEVRAFQDRHEDACMEGALQF